jgi:hypothetical protein
MATSDWWLNTFNGAVVGAVAQATIVNTLVTTVAQLPDPAAAGAGARAFCTDLNLTAFNGLVTGGGTFAKPVYSDGTQWLIG